ncbi:MAG: adenylate/guanylate cyclase domain-containing protein, partial [Ignavibacteria bacterium]|nr:adenylate/guanylate cyclase domain-containing protein [Ignavibacteria bacterium]
LHVGPVTAGVLGKERLQYDIWGDTVNVASRMEGSSEPNRIHVSENFAQAFEEAQAEKHRGNGLALNCHVAFRGETVLKGKGLVNTFWLSAD